MRTIGRLSPALAAALALAASAESQTVDVSKLGYERGDPAADIQVVEFADFACSACGQFARDVWPQVQREFLANGRVQWKYVPFALGMFANGEEAARAAECAADQDSFWSMHDLLYERQKEWSREKDPRSVLQRLASQLGLDSRAFARCYQAGHSGERIRRNDEAARELMVRATPTFFVNGQRVVGALPIEEWRKVIALVSGRGPD